MESIEKFGFKIGNKLGLNKNTNKTVDEEYNRLKLSFDNNEKLSANLNKHVAQLIENYHAMSTILHFIAEDVRDIYAGTEFEENAKKFMAASQEIEKKCVIPFQEKATSAIVDPVKQYHSEFAPLRKLHDNRNKLKQEQEFYSQKVTTLASKQNNKNPLELPKAKEKLASAEEEFEKGDMMTKQEFTSIIEKRVDVYNPAFNTLLESMSTFYSETSNICVPLQQAKISGDVAPVVAAPKKAPQALPQAPSSKSAASVSVPEEFNSEWFYLDENVAQQGPITFAELKKKFKSGQFNGDSYVFGGEMADWGQIKVVPKLLSTLLA